MRILSVSDHVEPILYEPGSYKCLSGIDLILSCGDLPPEYLTYLVTVFNVPLFYIRGNHDAVYELKPPQGCVDLHGKMVVHKGIRILGLEGCHWYNGGLFQYTENQMARMVLKTRLKIWWHRGVDIIISHAPPKDVHDRKDACHRGFKCFRGLINRYSPTYFLHGHIHTCFKNEKERTMVVNGTSIINTFGYHVFDYIK
ncbi:MAG: metallophosphoesterase [Desulfobacterales bacterium]|nr:metallophosphoesterase [Desulfobacterales bacterium]